MIKNITLELNHDQSLALRDLIEGFFDYQARLGFAEGSSRIILASQLLKQLPDRLDGLEGLPQEIKPKKGKKDNERT